MEMDRRKITITIISLLLISTTNTIAIPTLGTIFSEPAYDSVTASTADYVTLTNLGAGGDADALATILLEQTAYSGDNILGIYNITNPSNKLELFSGADGVVDCFVPASSGTVSVG